MGLTIFTPARHFSRRALKAGWKARCIAARSAGKRPDPEALDCRIRVFFRIIQRPRAMRGGPVRTPAPATGPRPCGDPFYTSTAFPTLKNHRHLRPTATPAAWDRARLYALSWGR